jgi:integrase
MRLYQRGQIWFVDFFVPGNRADGRLAERYRLSTGQTLRSAALARAAEIITRHTAAQIVTGSSITVQQWVDMHIDLAVKQQWEKPRSINDSTKPRLLAFARKFGSRPLAGLKGSDILAWIESLFVSAATKRTYYRVLHASFHRAMLKGYLSANPLNRDHLASLPKADEPEIEMYEDDEERRLIDAAQGTTLLPILMLCRYAGLRVSEALHLEWQDISWSRRTITVKRKGEWSPKSHKARRVPLAQRLYAYLDANKRADGPVCPRPDGEPYHHAPWDYFHALCRTIGVRPLSFHALRHSFATRLLERGATHYQVSKLLGHSSTAVTEKFYGHVQAADLAKVMELL